MKGNSNHKISLISPRVWGWSAFKEQDAKITTNFPTRVGMVRFSWARMVSDDQFPHACGDGPVYISLAEYGCLISPRVWGWSGSIY